MTLLTVGLLIGASARLYRSQRDARGAIASRFDERARVSAALTESLFSSAASSSQATNANQFGTPRVRAATLDAEVSKGGLVDLVLLDRGGAILARSSRTPAAVVREIQGRPSYVRAALSRQSFSLSNVLALANAGRMIQFAQPLATPSGLRVLVSGFAPKLLYQFISGYLAEIPNTAGGHAYVLDGLGAVLGGQGRGAGGRVGEPGLIAAVARGHRGSFTGGRWFASSPIRNSAWKLVVTAKQAALFASVDGVAKWLPWLLLAGFGLIAGLALVLVGRLVRGTAELHTSQERYALAVRGANDGIWDADFTTRTMYYSPRWKAMLGCSDDQITDSHTEWKVRVHPDDAVALQTAWDEHVSVGAGLFEHENRMKHSDGSYRWFLTRGVAVRDGAGVPTRMAGSMSDITERKHAEEQLRQGALHDALTGLPNRTLFMDRLSLSLAQTKREPDHRCAVMFLDLDRFKRINDGFSHAVGDELLVALGRRLSGILRPGDTVARGGGADGMIARLGGDEFTILLDDLSSSPGAVDVARRIQASLEQPFRIQDRELFVSTSIGISISNPGSEALELMRNADIAMYDAKRQGTARWSVFTDEMHSRVLGQVELETELRKIIQERRLRVFYQPVVSLTSGRLVGLEALARWPAELTPVSPDRFIAIAEDTGMIADLGQLVLQEACSRLSDWRQRGLVDDDVTMSVNVSGRQLGDPQRVVADVRAELASGELPPRLLRLEITESTVLSRPERVRAALFELEDLGVRAEIDDFGTGYASLTFLQSFPGDTLKIDRSFISTMHTNQAHETIVEAIVALAHKLGMNVIAEGIENAEQLELLRALGCASGQGYLFAKPSAPDELEPIIAAMRLLNPIAEESEPTAAAAALER